MIEQIDTEAEFDPLSVAYTGPGTLAGNYMRSFWQPVYSSGLLKNARPRQVKILGEDFTLFRDSSGVPNLLDNRCAHRGTQLSIGSVEGDTIRCLYHGWRYKGDGQCVEQPGEPQPFCNKIRIRSYPVREYLGIIFAYFGEGQPPEFTRYERFEAHSDSLRLMVEIAPFNYFQRLENSHDFVHLPFVHKQAFGNASTRTLETVVPRISSDECSWGILSHRVDPNGQDLIAYFGMPNINYIVFGGGNLKEWEGQGELLLIRVPVDDHTHLQFQLSWTGGEGVHAELPTTEFGPSIYNARRDELAQAVLKGDMTIDDVIATAPPADLFSIEDDVVMIGQGTIWQRSPEHLGRSDAGIILLRKLWTRDLRALREGRSRQQWSRPADMFPKALSIPRDARK